MPQILIACPETSQPIPTGIDAPVEFFAHSTAQGSETVCPDCDRAHA